MKRRILTIVGARPQFIKAAAISHVINEKYSDQLEEDILHTGQHYDDAMSGAFFRELSIPAPRHNLGVGSAPHGRQTGEMMAGIETVLAAGHYDAVLVYGDTNSTLAGALAAAKMQIPVYHVEAGLRSFNRAMPEEINRVVADHLSTLLFAPTPTAVDNLRNEGFAEESIVLSGDVMYDNVLRYSPLALERHSADLPPAPFILATLHRDFNTDNSQRLASILSAIGSVAEQHDMRVLFPIHPRTKKSIDSMTSALLTERFLCTGPLSYLSTLAALQRCTLVMTDSGGLQKEAAFCGKASVVLRPETEWVELVDDGAAILADADEARIGSAAARLLGKATVATQHFGDGTAADKIIAKIIS